MWVRWAGRRLERDEPWEQTGFQGSGLQGNRVIEGNCFLLSGTRVTGGWALAAASGIPSPILLFWGAALTLQTLNPHSPVGCHIDM